MKRVLSCCSPSSRVDATWLGSVRAFRHSQRLLLPLLYARTGYCIAQPSIGRVQFPLSHPSLTHPSHPALPPCLNTRARAFTGEEARPCIAGRHHLRATTAASRHCTPACPAIHSSADSASPSQQPLQQGLHRPASSARASRQSRPHPCLTRSSGMAEAHHQPAMVAAAPQ